MSLPNKIFSYNDSILSKFPIILEELKKAPLGVSVLYFKINKKIPDINDYIKSLDYLFALEKIEYDIEEGVLKYVS